MKSLDRVFLSEFEDLVRSLSAVSVTNIFDLKLPLELESERLSLKMEQVTFKGIEDKFFSSLNDSFAFLFSRPKLYRRKFNSEGEYVYKDGKPITEDVVVPSGSVAVLSTVKVGVPLSHKSSFDFVDIYEYTDRYERKSKLYIYIIPREFCYKVNLCALCISLDKPKRTFGGAYVYLKTGRKIFVFVAPYNVTSFNKTFRAVSVKPTCNMLNAYRELIIKMISLGYVFNIDDLWLSETIGDKNNAGYGLLDSTIDEYVQYDMEHSMASDKNSIEELDIL